MGSSLRLRWGVVGAALALLGFGCDGGGGTGLGDGSGNKPGVSPEVGATEFVSADSQGNNLGGHSGLNAAERSADAAGAPKAPSTAGMAPATQREVERGDI